MGMKNHTHVAWCGGALTTAALALAIAGCGGSSGRHGTNASAADFIRQTTTEFSRGQAGRLWDTLHPADQAIVSRARYIACQTNVGFDLQNIKVLDSYSEPIDIAGKSTRSTAVSLRVSADDGVTTATMHAISLGGGWRWILSTADYAAYKHGKCPAT